MPVNNNTITLTLDYRHEEYRVHTCVGRYHSLMELISDHLSIPQFGLCSGMGSCGTCMVEISEKYSCSKSITLACGVYINDGLANVKVFISGAVY